MFNVWYMLILCRKEYTKYKKRDTHTHTFCFNVNFVKQKNVVGIVIPFLLEFIKLSHPILEARDMQSVNRKNKIKFVGKIYIQPIQAIHLFNVVYL